MYIAAFALNAGEFPSHLIPTFVEKKCIAIVSARTD